MRIEMFGGGDSMPYVMRPVTHRHLPCCKMFWRQRLSHSYNEPDNSRGCEVVKNAIQLPRRFDTDCIPRPKGLADDHDFVIKH